MMIEFVGGSQDGAMLEIPPEMNYKLRFPFPKDVSDISEKPYACEEYEYKEGRYHFIGYEQ